MAKIGIFDSGVGGLSVFREIQKILPGESYIYFSDSANCPYGSKPVEFILDRSREITEMLLKKGADIIVAACNTATAVAIETLRAEYSDNTKESVRQKVMTLTGGKRDHVRFIGMEPAIKPAAAMTRNGIIGVLATAGTLRSEKYLRHKEKYATDTKIAEHVGEGFVELVENGITSGPRAEETVRRSIEPLMNAQADTIVLGCTHYPFLADTIRKVASELSGRHDIFIIDPAPAIAKRLLEVIEEEGIPAYKGNTGREMSSVELMSSGDEASLKEFFSKI